MSEPRAEPQGDIGQAPETLGTVVATCITRLRGMWPDIDTPGLIAEYRHVLTAIGDIDLVKQTFRDVIDTWKQALRPPPGVFASRGAELQARRDWRGHTSSDKGLRFLQAAPDHRDPPGTIRWIVVQPDGTRIPAGVRSIDDMGGGR